jgi:soluble lytic murein transglycosylase-like protein
VDVPTAEIEHFEAAPSPASGSGLPASTDSTSATAVVASHPADLNDVVNEASGRYRLDPDLVNSVIKAESGFNVRAVSRKGAQGLMQLMPGTASQLGVPNAFDPEANVDGGARYLRELLERYNFDLVKALAAYNAGTKRVEQYGGLPPYYETRAYVRRIVLDFNKKKLAQKSAVAPKSSAKKAASRVSTSKPPVDEKSSLAQTRE